MLTRSVVTYPPRVSQPSGSGRPGIGVVTDVLQGGARADLRWRDRGRRRGIPDLIRQHLAVALHHPRRRAAIAPVAAIAGLCRSEHLGHLDVARGGLAGQHGVSAAARDAATAKRLTTWERGS